MSHLKIKFDEYQLYIKINTKTKKARQIISYHFVGVFFRGRCNRGVVEVVDLGEPVDYKRTRGGQVMVIVHVGGALATGTRRWGRSVCRGDLCWTRDHGTQGHYVGILSGRVEKVRRDCGGGAQRVKAPLTRF